MDLISAIRSGKRIRLGKGDWIAGEGFWNLTLSNKDILSDQWEIQEEKIALTAEQIRRAINKAWATPPHEGSKNDLVLKELGFKG